MPKKPRATSLENIFVSDAHRQVYAEISYLKRRIHLVEGERKANYEFNEDVLKKSEERLKEVKEKNQSLKSQRKVILRSKETFITEISTKLGSEKKAYEFKDKKYDDVLDILECKIGTLRNKQNYLTYTKGKQAKSMLEVVEDEKKLHSYLDEGKTEKIKGRNLPLALLKRLETIKSTETAAAAMLMKISEADNIRSRYKNMRSLLKTENFGVNVKVTEIDKKLLSHKTEIERMRQVIQDAQKARKIAKARLNEVEDKTMKDYAEREQDLYDARLQLKIIHEKMEQIGARLSFPKFHMIHRDSSIAEGLYAGYQEGDEKRDGKMQSAVETVYTELANIIGEPDPVLIVERFQEQREHAKELVTQEENAKSLVRKAKLRKRFLMDKLKQLQYSGGLKREKLDTKMSKVDVHIRAIVDERDRLKKWLEDHFQAMEQMLIKLTEICKNNDFKIPPAALTSEIQGENVSNLLKFVLKQLEKLLGSGFNPASSPLPPTPSLTSVDGEKDTGEAQTGLLPFEITAEGPVFNLPSPVGSTTSFRLGSISDAEGMSNLGLGGLMGPSISQLGDTHSDILGSFRDRAPSILIQSHSQDFLEVHPSHSPRDVDSPRKTGSSHSRRQSSDEEEALSRTLIKRQSQLLYEAKTRKGRFNPSGGSGGGGMGGFTGSPARKKP